MSCNYADGLSPYEHKGVLGVPEKFDTEEKVKEKCLLLTEWIKNSKHVVVHTGAGISTAAGIPDFRGPNGVWTLEKEGKKPEINVSFNEAIPTKTHMALKHLVDMEYIHYVISQNIDGLHLKTGVPRNNLAELHGNMFIGQCDTCDSQFVRPTATSTVGQKYLGEFCKRYVRGRTCRGRLRDTILDWEADLPEDDLEMSDYQSSIADINICLGTTLQIVPSGNLPLRCKKYGGKLVVVNLQPTKHDKKADLIINTYVDNVIEKIMKNLSLEIPEYSKSFDPTKTQALESVVDWNIAKTHINLFKKKYEDINRIYKSKKKIENDLKKLAKNTQVKKRIKKHENINGQLNLVLEKKPKLEETDYTAMKRIGNTTIKKIENKTVDIVDLSIDSEDDIFVE